MLTAKLRVKQDRHCVAGVGVVLVQQHVFQRKGVYTEEIYKKLTILVVAAALL
jgi:hypothetical protein